MKTLRILFFTLATKFFRDVSETATPSHHFIFISLNFKWLGRVEQWVERGCSRVEQGWNGEGDATTSTLINIFYLKGVPASGAMVEREKHPRNIFAFLVSPFLLNKNYLIFSLYSGFHSSGFYSTGAVLASTLWQVSIGRALRGSDSEPKKAKTETTIYGIIGRDNYQKFKICNIFNRLQVWQTSVNILYVKYHRPPPLKNSTGQMPTPSPLPVINWGDFYGSLTVQGSQDSSKGQLSCGFPLSWGILENRGARGVGAVVGHA
jgi:hypothetical protein